LVLDAVRGARLIQGIVWPSSCNAPDVDIK
jgi:hypothetical protein